MPTAVRAIPSRQLCRVHATPASQRPTPGNDPRLKGAGNPGQRPAPGNDSRLSEVAKSQNSAETLEVVKLQNANVQGVAMVDSGANDWESNAGRVALLATGDAAALLVFAIIGRINHGEVLDVETLETVLPFWLGWFAAAPLLGGFGREAQGGRVGPAAFAAARTWAVATPVALALRAASRGYVPPTPFIAVAFVTTGVLLIGWRSALAAATKPEEELTPLELLRRRKNKTGTAFEFMQLLQSLTNRW